MAQFDAGVGNNFMKQITSVKSLKLKTVSGLVREMYKTKDQKCNFISISITILLKWSQSSQFQGSRHPFYFFIAAILAALSFDTFFTPCLSNSLSSHAWTFGYSLAGSKESPTALFILCCHVTKARFCIGEFVTDEILTPY